MKDNLKIRRNVQWMKRLYGIVSIVLAIFLLLPAAAKADIAIGTVVTIADDGQKTLNIPSVTISGSNRALVVAVLLNDNDDQRVNSVIIDPLGVNVALTWLDNAYGSYQDDGYCVIYGVVNPPTGTFDIEVDLTAATQSDEGFIAGAWPLTGVDQANPFRTAVGNQDSTGNASVTVTSEIDDLVLGAAFVEGYNGSRWMEGSDTEDWDLEDGPLSNDISVGQHKDGAATSTTLNWTNDSYSGKWVAIGVAVAPAKTTIGDGTSPADKDVTQSRTNNAVDAFTLATNSAGTIDTVTALTVTFTGTAVADVATNGVKIYEDNGTTANEWDSGDTLKGTASFSGTTASVSVSISVDSTATQYLVTYDIAATATVTNTLQGSITAATVSNILTNNDTTDATLTVVSPSLNNIQTATASSSTTCTYTNYTVPAVNNRILLVFASGEDNTNEPDVEPVSATFNSLPMTRVLQGTDYENGNAMFYLLNPDQITADVVVTYAGNVENPGIIVATLSDAKQQGPEVAASKLHSNTDTINTEITTVTDNSLVIDHLVDGQSYTLGVTQGASGQTEEKELLYTDQYCAAISSRLVATAGTVTLGWSHSGSSAPFIHHLYAFAPVGGTPSKDCSAADVHNIATYHENHDGDATATLPNYPVGAFKNRILVVSTSGEDQNNSDIVPVSATYGGTSMDLIYTQQSTGLEAVGMFYLLNPPAGLGDIVVTFTGNVGEDSADGVHIHAMTLEGVAQQAPEAKNKAGATAANYSTSVTTLTANALVLDITVDGREENMTPSGTGQTELRDPLASNGSNYAISKRVVATPGGVTFGYNSPTSDGYAIILTAWEPDYTTYTTIGDGTSPANKDVLASSTNNAVNAFTLETGLGTDTVTALTVTFTGTNVADVASSGVKIYEDDGTTANEWDSGDTLKGTASFSGTTADVSVSIQVDSTPTQYLVTYDMAAAPTMTDTLQGAITAATATNSLDINDTTDATLTVITGSNTVELAGSWLTGTTHTAEAGSDRVLILVGSIAGYNDGDCTISSASYGGQPLTFIESRASSGSYDSVTEVWYLDEAGIAAASGSTFSVTWLNSPNGERYMSGFYTGVNQTTPIGAQAENWADAATPNPITTTALSNSAGDMVVFAAGGNGLGSYTAQNGFTEQQEDSWDGGSPDLLTHTVADKAATGSAETPSVQHTSMLSNQIIGFVLQVEPDKTTIGDGSSPPSKEVVASSTNNAVNAFTLSTNTISDTVTEVTVTFTGTDVNDVAASGVKIYEDNGTTANEWDSGDTLKGTGSFSGTTAAVTVSIPVDGSATQYLVTYDIVAAPTITDTLQGAITAATASNTVVNNDSVDATLTVASPSTYVGDGSSPADKDVAPSSTNNAVDAFTLFTNTVSDTVTELTVTFTGTDVNDVAASGVKIYEDNGTTADEWDSGDTLKGTASFSGTTAAVTVSIAVDGSATQYLVTYDIVASPTHTNTLQGAITAATATNTVVNSDTTDATLTVDTSYDQTYDLDTQAGAEADWDFVGPSGTLLQTRGTAGYWSWSATDTPSGNVGPNAPQGGSAGFVYTETSDPTLVDDEFTMTLSGTVDASSYDLHCSFYRSMDFDGDAGELHLEVWDGDSWENEGTWYGGTDASWVFADIDLTHYYNTDFKVRFRTVVKGTNWHNDCGIDTVRIYGDEIGPRTVVGDGIAPSNINVEPSTTNHVVDAFTLYTNTGTDTVNELTVTFTGTAVADVDTGGVKIWDDSTGSTPNEWDAGDTEKGSASFSGTTAAVSVTISVNSTPTQYLVTYNIATGAGDTNTLQGAITAASATNTLDINDFTNATLTVLHPVTTVGDGSTPASKNVAPSSTDNAVNAFTLATNIGTDTVTELTVTFTGTAVGDVASSGVKIYDDSTGGTPNEWDAGDTLKGTGSFSGTTAAVTVSIPVTTSAVQYLITYDIAGGATETNTLQGAITAATAGDTVNITDNNDATLTVLFPTNTIGDGTTPPSINVEPSTTNHAVNAFTLATSIGTDTVTELTVTFTGTAVGDVATGGVKIWEDNGTTANEWDSGDTEKGSASFSGTTAAVTVSIPVDTSATQYLVTYNIAAGAGDTNTLQGAITAATTTYSVVNNDTTDATLTVMHPVTTIGDGSSPADKTVAVSTTNNAVNAFTLATNIGTDTVTELTVTFTGTDVSDVATSGVKIWEDNGSTADEWDSGDTEKGSASFSGTTAAVTVSIPVDDTATQYLVTYNIAAGATPWYTLQGAITAASTTDTVVNNDTTDATLTVSAGGDILISTGRFVLNTGTGTQQITGVGFQPKAYILFYTKNEDLTDDIDSTAGESLLSIGMTDGINQFCMASGVEDNQGSGDVGRRGFSDRVLASHDAQSNQSVDGEASHSSMEPDGFIININNDFTDPASPFIHYIAFGGSDLSVDVDMVDLADTLDDYVTVTDPGFEADVVIASYIGVFLDASGDASNDRHSFSLGWAVNPDRQATGNQFSMSVGTQDGQDPTKSRSRFDNVRAGTSHYNDATDAAFEIGNFDATGFRVTTRLASATTNEIMGYMALKLGTSNPYVYTVARPALTTIGDDVESGTSFQPIFLMGIGSAVVTAANTDTDGGSMAIGITDGTDTFAISWFDQDNVTTTNSHNRVTNTQFMSANLHSGAIDWEATFSSFSTNGWTINYGDAAGAAYQNAFLAIGKDTSAATYVEDGSSPANKDVAKGSTNNAVNAFTLATSSDTDTVTELTVTFTGTNVADVATGGVKIYEDNGTTADEWDSGDTEKGSASFSGTTAAVAVSISVNSTPTQYLVTYNIATGATTSNTLQGAVTAGSATNTLVINDTTDATLTVSGGVATTTTVTDGIWAGSQRYCHYANGYYWIVFYDGTDPVIYSSPDASEWASQGDITADHTNEVEKAADIAVRFSGTTMIAVFSDSTSGGTNGADGYNDIFYRKATLNNDGTVTWWPTSSDHVAVDGGSDDEFVYAGFDSENMPWIGGTESANEDVHAREGSALESPSWTSRQATPAAATNGSDAPTAIFPVADTGDMYFIRTIYYSANKDLWGIAWDQSAVGWGSWTTIVSADLYGADDDPSRDAVGLRWSAVKTGNGEIHLVYIDQAGNINHRKGTDVISPVWSVVDADITGETSHRKVTLAADGNELYVFYDKNDNKIYYRKYNGSSWEGECTLKSDSSAIQGAISAYESSQNNEIGVIWVEGAGSPYLVKFATINSAETTTIGDGASPAGGNVERSSTNNAVDAFTLVTDTGTDTVTALTVTFTGTNVGDVAASGVKIYDDSTGGTPNEWDAGDTLKGTASFSGTTADVTVSIAVDTSATQYLVTYDIAADATFTNTLQGAITAATLGNTLVNNDTTDATLTVTPTGIALLGSWGIGTSHTKPAGSNRALIFIAGAQVWGDEPTLTSVTYGGQSLTKINDVRIHTDNHGHVEVWMLDEAGIAAASTATFVPTWNVAPSDTAYSHAFFSNVHQTNSIYMYATNTTETTTPNPITTVALNTNFGDMVVVAAGGFWQIGTYAPQNGFTEGNDQQVGDCTLGTAYKAATGAAETPSMTHSDASGTPYGQVIAGMVLRNVESSAYRDGRLLGWWRTGLIHPAESGSNRLLLFVAGAEKWSATRTLSSVTYGGQSLTKIDNTSYDFGGSNIGVIELWYLDEAGIAAATDDTFVPTWSGDRDHEIYASAFFAEIDQTTPTGAKDKNTGTANPITTTGLATSSGDIVVTAAVAAYGAEMFNPGNGFTEGNDHSANDSLMLGTAYKKATGATETPSMQNTDSNLAGQLICGVVLQKPTTTIGDGTSPADKNVAQSSTNNAVNAFTLATSSGNDTVTELTVTFTGTDVADVATGGVKIYDDSTGGTPNEWDAGDTQKGSASFSGTTAAVSVSISVDSTPTQYLVTYDIVAGATDHNTLQGAITAATADNTLANNDTGDATLIVSSGVTTTIYSAVCTNAYWGSPDWAGQASESARDERYGIRHYTSLSAWESARDRDLTTANQIEVCEIVGDDWSTPDNTAVTIDEWVTDSTRYIVIKTVGDAYHNGTAGAGYVLSPGTTDVITVNESYVEIDGIEITGYADFSGLGYRAIHVPSGSDYVKIHHCLLHQEEGNNYGEVVEVQANNCEIYRNIIYAIGSGNDNYGFFGQGNVYNNTVYGQFRWGGICSDWDSPVLKNNFVHVTHTDNPDDYRLIGGSWGGGSDYNASNDSTAPGSNTLPSLDAANQYDDPANGDFDLKATADLRDPAWGGANNLGSPYDYDIDNVQVTGTWDVGADEYVPPNTTTIGDGNSPSNKTVGQGSTNNAVDAFTLATSSGGDTVTELTVTFTGTAVADVDTDGVKIYEDNGSTANEWDSNDTLKGTASFSGTTAAVTVSLSVDSTATQYLVTYDIASGATDTNTLQGAITAASATNTVDITDTTDATLTISSYECYYYYRRPIKIQSSQVMGTSDHSHFPVLVSLSGNWLRTSTEDPANGHIESEYGYDIIFKDTNGAQLDHEIEEYDGSATGGTLVAWVRIPVLSYNTDTYIFMYYGNPCIAFSQEDIPGVWNDNYMAVWHMSQTPDTDGGTDEILDSNNTNHGDSQNMEPGDQTAGRISGALNFDGTDEKLIVPSSSSMDDITTITVEAWINPTGWGGGGYGRIYEKKNDASTGGYELYIGGTSSQRLVWRSNRSTDGVWDTPDTSIALTAWQYVAVTYDSSLTTNDPSVYIGDILQTVGETTPVGSPTTDVGEDLNIGNDDGNTRGFNGLIDEFRVSDTIRSDGWIKTCYNNQKESSTFLVVEDEQDLSCEYSYRKSLKIQASQVVGTSDHQDFPMLVSLSGNWLKLSTVDQANGHIENPNGYDIIFKDTGGTQLDHEIEEYDGSATGGTLVAWVRIPVLDYNDDTVIYMYYGNPCIDSSTENVAGVWDDYYVGVWHLKEEQSGSTANDLYQNSKTNNHHGDDRTDGTAQNGKINGGQQFSGDGDGDSIQVAHHADLNLTGDMTISYWFHATENSGVFNRIVDKGYSTSYYFGGGDGTNDLTFYLSNNIVFDTANDTFTIDAWHYAAVTYDSTSGDATLILDGNESGTGNYTGGITGNTNTLYISHSDPTYDFAGYLDEVRISNTDRSLDWLKTEHNNQSSPSTFYIEGSEDDISCTFSYRKELTIQSSEVVTSSTGTWQVSAGDRDAHDDGSAGSSLTNCYFGDSQWNDTGGYQFAVDIPQGATINSAKLKLYSASHVGATGAYTAQISIEDTVNASAFDGTGNNIKGRSFYGTTVNWSIPSSGLTPAGWYESSDITDLVQYIVNKTSWSPGNYMCLAVEGTSSIGGGYENIQDYSDDTSLAAKLEVTYTTDSHQNFPMLVNLSGDWLKTTAEDETNGRIENSNGYDIIFRSADGRTQLDHEIEKYDGSATGGTLVAWVRIPTLSTDTDTVIYMYYGNPCIDSSTENAAGVWDDDYAAVWHLSQTPDTDGGTDEILDSNNSNHGDSQTMEAGDQTAGRTDGALDFNGTDDYVRFTNSATFKPADKITLSAWINQRTLKNYGGIISLDYQGDGTWGAPYKSYALIASNLNSGKPTLEISTSATKTECESTTVIQNSQWYYVAGTYNGSEMKIYVNDGTPENTLAKNGSIDYGTSKDLAIGQKSPYAAGEYFDGLIDEVRISTKVRTQGWIETEFNNQQENSTFFIEGDEDDLGDCAYAFYKQITIESDEVFGTSDHTDFPFLVNIASDNDLRTTVNNGDVVRSEGYDIIFRDSYGRQLDHEIEQYEPTSGKLVAWIRIPTLSLNVDTVIYMYYGNPCISSSQENADGVWEANYKGVWHLKESGTGAADEFVDSSGTSNHGQGGSEVLESVVLENSNSEPDTTAPFTLNFGFTATAGRLLIAAIGTDKGSGGYTLPPGGWTELGSYTDSSVGHALYYKVAAGGETSIQFDWTSSSNGSAMWVGEYSGLTATPLDKWTQDDSGGVEVTSQSTGTTATTTQADEFIITSWGSDSGNTIELGHSYTNGSTERIMVWSGGSGRPAVIIAERTVSAIGTYSETFNTTDSGDNLSGIIATFKIATSTGAPTQTPGRISNAQDFDGNDDYLSAGDPVDGTLDFGTGDFTVTAWVKTSFTSTAYKPVMAAKGAWGNTGFRTEMQVVGSDGYLYGIIQDPTTFAESSIGTAVINDGQWHHVVWVYDRSSNIIGYRDGVEVGTFDISARSGSISGASDFYVGKNDGGNNWQGTIDEVRVSNITRDAGWIKTCYYNQKANSTFYSIDPEEQYAPTAVDLISFTATGQISTILVEWETAQEIDNLGFNLYRTSDPDGSYTKVNSSLIPGLLSSVTGRKYTHIDGNVTRGVLYYYMLEDVDLKGVRTMHGPICVDWDGDGIPDDSEDQVDGGSDDDTGDSNPEAEDPDNDWTPASSYASWIELASFKARQESDGVALEWETSSEVDVLGFNVYREVDGKFERVTANLVPASVFKVGASSELPARRSFGQSYVYWDGLSEGTGHEVYWLDSLEINGGRASFGPITPEISGQPIPKRLKARFRSIGKHQASRALELKNIHALRDWLNKTPAKAANSRVSIAQVAPEPPSEPRLRPNEEQWLLAAQSGIKIYIRENGWYRVGQPELVAAGLNPDVDPRYLRLYADGEERSMTVLGSDDGRFDPVDAVEFYGRGLDRQFSDARVYWLVVGSRPGRRIDTPFIDIRLDLGNRMRIPRGLRGRGAPLSFPYYLELRERTIYFAALKNGERENFFGSVISTEPVDQLLTIAHPDLTSPKDAMMRLVLQGATDFTHQVKILFNYVELGEVVFSGQEERETFEIQVPHDLLLEGDNIVTLTAQGGPTDISLVDRIRLNYWRTYTADNDVLQFKASGGEWHSIGGFSSSEIRVVDITDPMRMININGKVMAQDSGYAITVKVPDAGSRQLLAFTEEMIKSPAAIEANLTSSWHDVSQGADVIIIGHRDLLESIEFLKQMREQQGWSVMLVDVEDLYDEFNYGSKSPWALRDFLNRAYQFWNPQPRFVLLVGDASYDPRNYLGFGEFDLVPTKFVDTEHLTTASDDWFVDFDDDGLPEMAVGRLPVESAEEAENVISKIMAFEGVASLMNDALLVADINDYIDFEGASAGVADELLARSMGVTEILRGKSATARDDLLSLLNQGQLLVNYVGHGSTKIWNGNLLTSTDAWNLTNSPYLPFLVSMTCLNGFFQDPYSESMAETFLKTPQGGAVAVWTSSGLTFPVEQTVMNKELVRVLFNGEGLTIGEAVKRAKQAVSNGDIRRTWILFGDPTLRLR